MSFINNPSAKIKDLQEEYVRAALGEWLGSGGPGEEGEEGEGEGEGEVDVDGGVEVVGRSGGG